MWWGCRTRSEEEVMQMAKEHARPFMGLLNEPVKRLKNEVGHGG